MPQPQNPDHSLDLNNEYITASAVIFSTITTPNLVKALNSDETFTKNILYLLAFLQWFEFHNQKTTKRYFADFCRLLPIVLQKEINIPKINEQAKVSRSEIDDQINYIAVYAKNLFDLEPDILKSPAGLETISEYVTTPKTLLQKLGKTEISFAGAPNSANVNNPADLKNFYPFDTKPKSILIIKHLIGILCICILFLTSITCVLTLIYGNTAPSTFVLFRGVGGIILQIMFNVIIYGISASAFLKVTPKSKVAASINPDVIRYNYPKLIAVILIIYSAFQMFNFANLFVNLQTNAAFMQLNYQLTIALKVFSIIDLVMLTVLVVFLIAGIFCAPKIDHDKMVQYWQNIQNKNTDSSGDDSNNNNDQNDSNNSSSDDQ